MRIPSQFNEDSLYRRGRGRADSSHSQRRLIRLLIALALVVVVMRQTSKPAIYQAFFGQPAAGSAASGTAGADTGRTVPRIPDPVSVVPADRHVAHLLTAQLTRADQRQWVIALLRWQSGQRVDAVPATIQQIQQQLESSESLSTEQRSAWTALFDSFLESTVEQDRDDSSAAAPIDWPRVAAFLSALDDAAAARVVDGSVWRSGDFDSFYRYLDQADDLPEVGIAATGVLPLLQQPEVFRNQLVRVHGGVARAQRMDAQENLYGITDYWQLWLRPSDGVDRPLVAIVPAVPPLVESVGRDAILREGPQIAIVGVFLKRLAYESAIGADLAPVVVGRIAGAQVAEVQSASHAPHGDSMQSRLWLTVAVASLLGFALAALVIFRTSVMAKRTRELRTANRAQPDQFLKGLADAADRGPPTHGPPTHEVPR